jgi:hypothetical protein
MLTGVAGGLNLGRLKMRAWWTLLLVTALAAAARGQEGGDEPKTPPDPAAEEPKEPPAWKMPEKDVRTLEKLISEALAAEAGDRAELLKKIEKFVEKLIDGHSPLEDVDALVGMANRARTFHGKFKKGQVQEVGVGPDAHGFPTGTVKYWLYLPKEYREDRLWPLLLCLPDQKRHGDGKKYIEEWLAKSPKVAEGFLVVVPQPHAKGADWTSAESLGRAMISLRHAGGVFGLDKTKAGPASDYLRIFLDGEDAASIIAARFAEVFAGVVLRGADGRAGVNVAAAGQLCGLPAYCVVDPKKKSQVEFAQRVKSANAASVIAEDEGLVGDPKAMGEWMDQLPARSPQPREIAYTIHDSSFQRHYWINVLDFDASAEPAASFEAKADRARNEVRVEIHGIGRFELFLSDALVDLNRPIKIVVAEDESELTFFRTQNGMDTVTRDLGTLVGEWLDSNHPWRAYAVKLVVNVREIKERAAAAQAQPEAPPPGVPGKPEPAKQSTEAAN